jgi:hypothetical protein
LSSISDKASVISLLTTSTVTVFEADDPRAVRSGPLPSPWPADAVVWEIVAELKNVMDIKARNTAKVCFTTKDLLGIEQNRRKRPGKE